MAAIVAGPAAGAVVGFGYGLLSVVFMFTSAYNYVPAFPLLWTGMVIVGAILGLIIGLPLMVALGLPIHSYLTKRGAVGSIDYVLAGTLAGILLAVIGTLLFPRSDGWDSQWLLMTMFGLGGPVAAYIAWLIRRPDRDEPPAHMPQSPTA